MPDRPPPSVADQAPAAPEVTAYDRDHIAVYIRLLDAAEEGASWEEAASVVLGIDPVREPERARRAYDSHLRRARWMIEHGYRDLLARS